MTRKKMTCLVFLTVGAVSACSGSSDSHVETSTEVSVPASSSTASLKAVDRGQTLFKKCRTCHTLKQDGRHKVGPNLYGIMDAPAGKKEGFNYEEIEGIKR